MEIIKILQKNLRERKIGIKAAVFIIKNFPFMSDKEMAEHLSLHKSTVMSFRLGLGLAKKEDNEQYNIEQSDRLFKQIKIALDSGVLVDNWNHWKKYMFEIQQKNYVADKLKQEEEVSNAVDFILNKDKNNVNDIVMSDNLKKENSDVDNVNITDEKLIEMSTVNISKDKSDLLQKKKELSDDIKNNDDIVNTIKNTVINEKKVHTVVDESTDIIKEKEDKNINFSDVIIKNNDVFKEYRKELMNILGNSKKLIKRLEDVEVFDKLLILRSTFLTIDWKQFVITFIQYLDVYIEFIDINFDFADIVGISKESIIQNKILKQITDLENEQKQIPSSVMKQYNDSVNRLQKYKDSLEKKIKERQTSQSTELTRKSFAELVLLFDDEDSRQALTQIDREEYDELLDVVEKIKKRAFERKPDGNFDGNEEGLLLGMDESVLDKIMDKAENILSADNIKKINEIISEPLK